MKTECPHCHTLFRVSEQQIHNAAGQVRCGHCLAIFTAELPRQMSFDDLLELDNESAVDNVTQPIFVQPQSAADSLDNETSLEQESVSTASEHVLPDVIPPALRAETRNGKQRFSFVFSLFWLVSAILLMVTAVAQYAWYDRQQLLQNPQLHPWFELTCNYLKCQLPVPRDISQIEILRKNIYSHPNDKLSLMVSGSMINQASYEQSFPLLELRFENIRGEVIAARQFKSDEYLDLPAEQIAKMKPAVPVAFTLEITDPGSEVVSYEFSFL